MNPAFNMHDARAFSCLAMSDESDAQARVRDNSKHYVGWLSPSNSTAMI